MVIQKLKNKRTIHALTSKTLLAIFIIMLIILTSTVSGVTVGVKKDDWAKYDFSASWTSNIPGQTKPTEIEEMENVEWVKVTVQSVSNTLVTVKSVTRYENGTEEPETMSGDIATGSGNLTVFIIPANLGEGDTIPISGTFIGGLSPIINGTETKTYAGAQREVNYIGTNISISNQTMDFYMYWDKATGILCEFTMSMSMSYMNYTASQSMQAKITGTNLWAGGIIPGVPDYMLYIIVAIVIIVIVVAAVFVMRKRKAPTPTAAPSKEDE